MFSNNLLMAAASISGGGFEVDYSCRFDAAGTSRMTRTPSSNGDDKTWTFSIWF